MAKPRVFGANRVLSRMRAAVLLVAVFVLPLIPGAIAAELGGSVDDFGKAFNQKAKSLSATSRAALAKCRDGEKRVCAFSGDGALVFMASSDSAGSRLTQINVMLAADPTVQKTVAAAQYIAAVSVLMALYAPDADATERGVVINRLARGATSSEGREEFLHGVRFHARLLDSSVWTTITRP